MAASSPPLPSFWPSTTSFFMPASVPSSAKQQETRMLRVHVGRSASSRIWVMAGSAGARQHSQSLWIWCFTPKYDSSTRQVLSQEDGWG
jgi:hypothetical protein